MERKVIRETGEIIDVVSFSCDTTPDEKDTVKCIDSSGERKTLNLNYYWDLEDVNEVDYWDNLRNKAAIKIFANRMATMSNLDSFRDEVIDISIKDANELIKKLKEQ